MSTISTKQKIAFAAALVLCLSVYLLFFSKKTTTVTPVNQDRIALIGESNSIDEADSDSDGLKDWEETLWGTLSNKPDTDEDGTPDGEEVKRGRDPLVPGPDDVFADKAKIAEIVKQSESFAKLNTTERLGQDLFAKILLAKQTNGEINEQIDEELIKDAIETLSVSQKDKEYDSFTFISNPDNSVENTKEYANKLIYYLQNNSIKTTDSELALLSRFALSETGDTEPLKKIAANSLGYAEIAQNYHKMAVPSDFIELHRKLTNTISHLSSDTYSMSQANTDPVLAIAAAGQFGEDYEESLVLLKEIAKKIKSKGIVFNNSDPGISFIRSL